MESPQTESSTDVIGRPDKYDTDYGVFVRAKDRGQATFTLVAQDATADLVVDFWVMLQLRIRDRVNAGVPLQVAIERERIGFGILAYPPDLLKEPKLAGALEIAARMRGQTDRRLAD